MIVFESGVGLQKRLAQPVSALTSGVGANYIWALQTEREIIAVAGLVNDGRVSVVDVATHPYHEDL